MNNAAYEAGYEAAMGGHPVSANPFSSADVDNFNDWDNGHNDATEANLEEDNQGWGDEPDADDYDDSMDGDFDSAMTSAGFGTDEDYGYYGECEDAMCDMDWE